MTNTSRDDFRLKHWHWPQWQQHGLCTVNPVAAEEGSSEIMTPLPATSTRSHDVMIFAGILHNNISNSNNNNRIY